MGNSQICFSDRSLRLFCVRYRQPGAPLEKALGHFTDKAAVDASNEPHFSLHFFRSVRMVWI